MYAGSDKNIGFGWKHVPGAIFGFKNNFSCKNQQNAWFWVCDGYEKWKKKKQIFFQIFHEKMIFYFIVLNVSKIVSEHYRHPRIPSRSLKNMQDNHKGTESRLKWVKSIKLRTDFFAFFVFSKKCFLNEKLIFHFIVLNVSSSYWTFIKDSSMTRKHLCDLTSSR